MRQLVTDPHGFEAEFEGAVPRDVRAGAVCGSSHAERELTVLPHQVLQLHSCVQPSVVGELSFTRSSGVLLLPEGLQCRPRAPRSATKEQVNCPSRRTMMWTRATSSERESGACKTCRWLCAVRLDWVQGRTRASCSCCPERRPCASQSPSAERRPLRVSCS